MERGVANEHEIGDPLIVVLGSYHNKGFEILGSLASFLREHGINARTVNELYPVPQSATSKDKLESSRRVLKQASGVLFVLLSHSTLQVPPETDITGGVGTEVGMMYFLEKMGEIKYRATLYDGNEIIKLISSLIRGTGWGYEAVAEQGKIEQIRALAYHLCRRLLEEINASSS